MSHERSYHWRQGCELRIGRVAHGRLHRHMVLRHGLWRCTASKSQDIYQGSTSEGLMGLERIMGDGLIIMQKSTGPRKSCTGKRLFPQEFWGYRVWLSRRHDPHTDYVSLCHSTLKSAFVWMLVQQVCWWVLETSQTRSQYKQQ